MKRKATILTLIILTIIASAGCLTPRPTSLSETTRARGDKQASIECVHAQLVSMGYQITTSDAALGVLTGSRYTGQTDTGARTDVLAVSILTRGGGVSLAVHASSDVEVVNFATAKRRTVARVSVEVEDDMLDLLAACGNFPVTAREEGP